MFDGVLEQFGLKYENYNEVIQKSAAQDISETEFIALELNQWLNSPQRQLMLLGDMYYNYDVEPEERAILWNKDADGAPVWKKLTDGWILDNQYALQVDKKVDYILGKPFACQTTNERYGGWLEQIFDDEFRLMLYDVAVDSYNSGLSWVHPYFNENGQLAFRCFPALEVLPFWADDGHTVLDMAARCYIRFRYAGRTRVIDRHVDVYKLQGVERYLMVNGQLEPLTDGPFMSYGIDDTGTAYSWGRVPLVAFRANAREMPLIKRGRDLQKSLNEVRAGWSKNMTDHVEDNILVIKEYGGESLRDFKRKLSQYGAVNVHGDGGVEVLRLQRDSTSYAAYLNDAKKALVEAYRGFDAKDERMGNNPNQMNIKSMYADIDLDADTIERQFARSFDFLLWFVDEYLKLAGAGDFSKEKVKLTFNRNMITNEADIISEIKNSQGIVSDETLLANHPFVPDVKEEQKRLARQQAQQMAELTGIQAGADINADTE